MVLVISRLLRGNSVNEFDLGGHLITCPVSLITLYGGRNYCQPSAWALAIPVVPLTNLMRLPSQTDIEVLLVQLFDRPILGDPVPTPMKPDISGPLLLLRQQVKPGSMLSPPIIIRVALSFRVTVTRGSASPKDLVDRFGSPRLILLQRLGIRCVLVGFHRREEEFVVPHVLGEDKDGSQDGVSGKVERHGSMECSNFGVLTPVETGSDVLDECRLWRQKGS